MMGNGHGSLSQISSGARRAITTSYPNVSLKWSNTQSSGPLQAYAAREYIVPKELSEAREISRLAYLPYR